MDDRQLLRGLSHELRAPLQALLGHVDLLRSGAFGALTDDQAGALETVSRSAERILAVAHDVLQCARLDAGREAVDAADFDLGELIEEEIDALAPMAEKAGVAFAAAVPGGLRVVSDPAKVRRILTNLLTNAIKYAAPGPVTVRGAREGARVVVEVADEGPGIPAGQEDAVFEEYVQLTPRGEGTGLGLPIARRLADLLGGSLVLRAAEAGATLRLELPA